MLGSRPHKETVCAGRQLQVDAPPPAPTGAATPVHMFLEPDWGQRTSGMGIYVGMGGYKREEGQVRL